jgi:hypothetical protein
MLARRNPLATFRRMKNIVAALMLQPGTIAAVLALEKSVLIMKARSSASHDLGRYILSVVFDRVTYSQFQRRG